MALNQGLNAHVCIGGLIKGIQQVGDLYTRGEYLLSDLYNSADAMEVAHDILEPAITDGQKKEIIALVVLEATDGTPNMIGKTLVGTMLTGKGLTDDPQIPFLHWLTSQ